MSEGDASVSDSPQPEALLSLSPHGMRSDCSSGEDPLPVREGNLKGTGRQVSNLAFILAQPQPHNRALGKSLFSLCTLISFKKKKMKNWVMICKVFFRLTFSLSTHRWMSVVEKPQQTLRFVGLGLIASWFC